MEETIETLVTPETLSTSWLRLVARALSADDVKNAEGSSKALLTRLPEASRV